MGSTDTSSGVEASTDPIMRPLKNVPFCSKPSKAKILTTGIHLVFRELEFEPDAGIGQKGAFFKGLE